MERGLIVECDLLPRLDVAKRDKENVVIEYFHVAVGFAGVVYVMSAISAFAAVQAPAIIDRADTEASAPGAAISFGVGYSLAGVLRYLSAAEKLGLRKTALTLNCGVLDFQTRMQVELHLLSAFTNREPPSPVRQCQALSLN